MTTLRDISLLLARIILGVVIFAHGWQKFNEWTVAGTGESFAGAGVPFPELSAQFATYFEMAGGVLLILGLLVRFIGPILAVQMVGAFWFMHRGTEIFASNGGWELVGVIAAAGLALAAAGAGRISLDHLVVSPFRKRKADKQAAAHGVGTSTRADAGTGIDVGAGTSPTTAGADSYSSEIPQHATYGNYGAGTSHGAGDTNTDTAVFESPTQRP